LNDVGKKIIESICDIKQKNKIEFLRNCYVNTFNPNAHLSIDEIVNIQEFIKNLLPESQDKEFS
ncbi:15239_t:CDS:1, partial [Dentiscutata heterogama]